MSCLIVVGVPGFNTARFDAIVSARSGYVARPGASRESRLGRASTVDQRLTVLVGGCRPSVVKI